MTFSDPTRQEKRRFFDGVDEIFSLIDDAPDDNPLGKLLAQARKSCTLLVDENMDTSLSIANECPSSEPNADPDFILSIKNQHSSQGSHVGAGTAETALVHRKSSSPSSRSSVSMASARRTKALKRGKDKRALDGIFSGMVFYFIPNNFKIQARKHRMLKAVANGATCLEKWELENVTHIIVGILYKYEDVLKELRLEKLPENKAIIINDAYISDCLNFGQILDYNDEAYAVSGYRNLVPAVLELSKMPLVSSGREPLIVTAGQMRTETTLGVSSSMRSVSAQSILENPPPREPEELSVASFRPKDELDEMIEKAKNINFHASLDEQDMSSENESEAESRSSRIKKRRITPSLDKPTFRCMSKNDDKENTQNPNARTIEVLSEMCNYYERVRDIWRPISYRKAIITLKQQKNKVMFASEAILLPGIGVRLSEKIEEIVRTDQLRRLEYAKLDPSDEYLKLFLGVYGAGLQKAQQWVAQGYKTLDDLLENVKLSDSQKVGILHYQDFSQRISREEVEKHGKLVRKLAEAIEPTLSLQIMGSFRRGAADCGDIDILITKEDAEMPELKRIFDKLVFQLFQIDFLKCGLAVAKAGDDGSKWHGASQLGNGPWRRIDFLFVPWAERGAALLYFTGNDIFNRSMRLLASKKGYRLNQRGLYKDVMRGPGRQRITDGTLVEGESEENIFKILGVPYRPPHHRIC